jgi:hypothetical protein
MSPQRGAVEAFLSSVDGASIPLTHAAFLLDVADTMDPDPVAVTSRCRWIVASLASHDAQIGLPATSPMQPDHLPPAIRLTRS